MNFIIILNYNGPLIDFFNSIISHYIVLAVLSLVYYKNLMGILPFLLPNKDGNIE